MILKRQVKLLFCPANKLRSTFAQCSTAIKNTLPQAYCMPANCGASSHNLVLNATNFVQKILAQCLLCTGGIYCTVGYTFRFCFLMPCFLSKGVWPRIMIIANTCIKISKSIMKCQYGPATSPRATCGLQTEFLRPASFFSFNLILCIMLQHVILIRRSITCFNKNACLSIRIGGI